MEGDGGPGDRKRTTFPWLGAMRYAVATLVAAIVVAMVTTAIIVVLRPAELDLSIASGAVSVEWPESPTSVIKYKITLRAYNPSGRAVIHYGRDNLVRLLDKNSQELTNFSLSPFVVPQQTAHYATMVGFLKASALSDLSHRLYDGENDMVLVQAKAALTFTIAGAKAVNSKGGLNFTFDCWPVSIGSYYTLSNSDVSCSLMHTASEVPYQKEPWCTGGCPPPSKSPCGSNKG